MEGRQPGCMLATQSWGPVSDLETKESDLETADICDVSDDAY